MTGNSLCTRTLLRLGLVNVQCDLFHRPPLDVPVWSFSFCSCSDGSILISSSRRALRAHSHRLSSATSITAGIYKQDTTRRRDELTFYTDVLAKTRHLSSRPDAWIYEDDMGVGGGKKIQIKTGSGSEGEVSTRCPPHPHHPLG